MLKPLLLSALVALAAGGGSSGTGCAACVQSGLTWTGTQCTADCSGPSCTTECCAFDSNHGQFDSWTCDDGCNTCTCGPDGVSATGCALQEFGPPQTGGQAESLESWLVRIALLPVAGCIICALAICYMMVCYKRKGKTLEPAHPLDEEDQQLAAGD